MRKLMWLTVGFAAACLLAIEQLWDSGMMIALSVALLIAVLSAIAGRYWKTARYLLAVSFGAAIAFAYLLAYQNIYILPLSKVDGQTQHLRMTVLTYTEPSRYSNMVDASVELEGKQYKARVYLNNEEIYAEPGDWLESDFRIRVTSLGGLKESVYYQGNGILLIASQKGEYILEKAQGISLRTLPAIMAHKIRENIRGAFPEDTAPFAAALLLGDSDQLSYQTDTALKISGIRHVAAASGLHIAILFSLVVAILGRNRFVTPIVSIAVMFFFAAVAGFTPSVTRACIMMSMIALEMTVNREYDGLTALSAACIVMLLMNPFMVNSVSLQLSVASVAGIYLFNPGISAWIKDKLPQYKSYTLLGKFLDFEQATISISLSTLITTTPLCAYYFHTVSLFSVVTNLLTLYVISGIFSGIALVCLVGVLLPGFAQVMAGILSWPIRYVLWIAKLISQIPFAAVYTSSYWIKLWILLCYGLILIHLISKRKQIRAAVFTACAALFAAVVLSWTLPRMDSSRMEVIYVGEGQSILLQSKGHSFLVDCGGNTDEGAADAVAETLLSQGIFKLDGIALTHYDRDHSGALVNLLCRVNVDRIYLPDMDDHGVITALRRAGIRTMNLIEEDTYLSLGTADLTLIAADTQKTENENCMCILFEGENCVILITGDRGRSGEKHLIEQRQLPDVDILIAGHHGSKNSTSQELLDEVTPELVIVSAGKNNSYGHPAQELLERLEENGCAVRRTDLEGTILIRR